MDARRLRPVGRGGRRRLAGALLVLALVASACGGNGGGGTADPPPGGGGSGGGNGGGGGGDGDPADGDDAWEAIVAAAQDEGTVIVNLHSGPGFERFGVFAEERMRELYGIELEWTLMRPSDMSPRVLTEQQAGEYLWDIHQGSGSNVYESLKPADALEPLPAILADLPEENTRDEDWGGGFELYSDPDDPVSFMNDFIIFADVAVDRSIVGDAFSSEEDMLELLSDDWSGQVAIYDPRAPGAGSHSMTWALGETRRDTFGDDFIRELFGNVEVVAERQLLTQHIAQGRYAVAIGAEPEAMAELQEQGIGEDVEFLDFWTYHAIRTTSVFKNPPNPNAVRVYLHWFFSPEAQEMWAQTVFGGSSRRIDVEPPDDHYRVPDFRNLEAYIPINGTSTGEDAMGTVVRIAQEVLG